jgi:hypothetical protein
VKTKCDQCGAVDPDDIHTCGVKAGAVQRREWVDLDRAESLECLAAGNADGWVGVMEATQAKLREKNAGAQPAACTWTKSADPHMPDTFDATCGVVWTFTDGGPAENDVRFCPGCGAVVSVADPEPEEDLFDLAVKADNGGQP